MGCTFHKNEGQHCFSLRNDVLRSVLQNTVNVLVESAKLNPVELHLSPQIIVKLGMNLHDNTALLIHQVERAAEPDDTPEPQSEPETPVQTPKVEPQPKYTLHRIEIETAEKLAKANKSCTEFLYLLANEPSIGLFHVEEHIRKSVNKFSETKAELKKNSTEINEALVDVDYALLTVKSLVGLQTFANIQNMLSRSHQIVDKLSSQENRGRPIGKPTHKELTSYKEKTVTYTEPASPSHNNFNPIKMQDQEPTQTSSSSEFLSPKKFE